MQLSILTSAAHQPSGESLSSDATRNTRNTAILCEYGLNFGGSGGFSDALVTAPVLPILRHHDEPGKNAAIEIFLDLNRA